MDDVGLQCKKYSLGAYGSSLFILPGMRRSCWLWSFGRSESNLPFMSAFRLRDWWPCMITLCSGEPQLLARNFQRCRGACWFWGAGFALWVIERLFVGFQNFIDAIIRTIFVVLHHCEHRNFGGVEYDGCQRSGCLKKKEEKLPSTSFKLVSMWNLGNPGRIYHLLHARPWHPSAPGLSTGYYQFGWVGEAAPKSIRKRTADPIIWNALPQVSASQEVSFTILGKWEVWRTRKIPIFRIYYIYWTELKPYQ